MLFNVRFMTLAALVVVVASQTAPPQCVLTCSQASLSSATNKTCTSIADPCVCTDTGFKTADGACLQANCTAADQAAALQLQQQLCGGGNATSTGATSEASTSASTGASSESTSMSGMTSMSGSMTSMQTGSSTGTGASSAASPTRSNGANAQAEFNFFTLGVAAAGAVVGGLFL